MAVVEEDRDKSPRTDEARPAAAPFDLKPRRWLYLLLAYFTLHVAIRTLVSSSADGDEAEQVMLAQKALWGYGSQPPLYTWLQIGFFNCFGQSVFSLALLKNLLLAGTYLLTYWNAKLVTRSRACGLAAALSLLFIEQIAWESQRDLTHSVLGATLAAATLLIFLRTHESRRLGWYISLGCCLGLGCLSKYNYLFWPLALTAAALSIPELRRTVLDKRMLVAVAICALVFLPNGVWILHHRAQAFSSAAKFNVQDAGSLLAALGVALRQLITAVLKFLGPLVLVYWGVFWKTPRRSSGAALTLGDDSAPAVYERFLKRSLLAVAVLLMVLVLGFRTAGIRDRWLQPVLIFAPVLAAAIVRERLDAVRLGRLVAAGGFVMLLVTVGLPGRILLAENLNRKEALTHPYRQLAQQMAGTIPESSLVLTTSRLMAGNLRLHLPGRLFLSLEDNALFADNPEHCFIAWDAEGPEQTYRVRLWLQGHGPGSGSPAGAVRYFTAPYQYHHQRQMRVALLQIR